jgi:hypothetical protein
MDSQQRHPQTRGSDPGALVSLYSLTLPGLDVRTDWRVVHDRLLDDFPAIDDVLPTTTVATLLIVYRGSEQVDRWLDSINDAVLIRRLRSAQRQRGRHEADPPDTEKLRAVGDGVYPLGHGTITHTVPAAGPA